jgi:hypothetical protein
MSHGKLTPMDFAKYLAIEKYGSEEIKERFRGTTQCHCDIETFYKEVMIQQQIREKQKEGEDQ